MWQNFISLREGQSLWHQSLWMYFSTISTLSKKFTNMHECLLYHIQYWNTCCDIKFPPKETFIFLPSNIHIACVFSFVTALPLLSNMEFAKMYSVPMCQSHCEWCLLKEHTLGCTSQLRSQNLKSSFTTHVSIPCIQYFLAISYFPISGPHWTPESWMRIESWLLFQFELCCRFFHSFWWRINSSKCLS